MTEGEFWGELRFRIIQSGQLAVLGYCDWLEVKRYRIGAPGARIEGLAGFLGPGKTYKFILVLPPDVESLDALDWASLLPDPERPGWAEIEEGLVTINTAAI